MINQSIDDLLELLSFNSIANVQNGLIHAYGIWLNKHVKGNAVKLRKREAYSTFARTAIRVAKQSQEGRKIWPEGRPLPSNTTQQKVQSDISKQVLRSIGGLSFEEGLKFLGELWGRWVVVCPETIIKNSPELSSIAENTKSNNELIGHMLRYLDLYGSL